MRNYAPMVNAGRELAQAFALQPAIEQRAAGNAIADSMRMALAGSKIGKYNSETDLNRKRLEGMDEGQNMFMRGMTGLNQQQLDELSSAIEQGWKERRVDGPPTPAGQPPVANIPPDWYTPEVKDRFNQAQVAMGANMAGTGKTNGEQLVNAMQNAINIGRQDSMIGNSNDPNDIARAMAAVAGKPTVSVQGGVAYRPYGSPDDVNWQGRVGGAPGAPDGTPGNILDTKTIVSMYDKQKRLLMEMRAEAQQFNPDLPLAKMTDQQIDMSVQKNINEMVRFLSGEKSVNPPVAENTPDDFYEFLKAKYPEMPDEKRRLEVKKRFNDWEGSTSKVDQLGLMEAFSSRAGELKRANDQETLKRVKLTVDRSISQKTMSPGMARSLLKQLNGVGDVGTDNALLQQYKRELQAYLDGRK